MFRGRPLSLKKLLLAISLIRLKANENILSTDLLKKYFWFGLYSHGWRVTSIFRKTRIRFHVKSPMYRPKPAILCSVRIIRSSYMLRLEEKFHCTTECCLVGLSHTTYVTFTERTPNSVFFEATSCVYTSAVDVLVLTFQSDRIFCAGPNRTIVYTSWVDYIVQWAPVSRADVKIALKLGLFSVQQVASIFNWKLSVLES